MCLFKDHDSSHMHDKSVDLENKELHGDQLKHVSTKIAEDNPIRVAFQRMSEVDRTNMCKLFECAYYIGKQARPYSDFRGLVELETLHGVNLPAAYHNENACKDFLTTAAEVIFDTQIRSKLQRCRFITVLCDGTTDAGIEEKEVIFVLFVDPDTFLPTTTFFALKSVQSQDAAGIKSAICKAFEDSKLQNALDRIVFLASDGASTNSGVYNGLIAKLQENYPWLVFIWCVSHRLELALKDSLKEALQVVEESLRDLYYMYQQSSKKLRELKDLFVILKGVYTFKDEQIRPTKSFGTRWIDHKVQAMKRFVDKLGVYVQHVENLIADTSNSVIEIHSRES